MIWPDIPLEESVSDWHLTGQLLLLKTIGFHPHKMIFD